MLATKPPILTPTASMPSNPAVPWTLTCTIFWLKEPPPDMICCSICCDSSNIGRGSKQKQGEGVLRWQGTPATAGFQSCSGRSALELACMLKTSAALLIMRSSAPTPEQTPPRVPVPLAVAPHAGGQKESSRWDQSIALCAGSSTSRMIAHAKTSCILRPPDQSDRPALLL